MRLRNIPGSKELLLARPKLVLQADSAPKGCWRQYFADRGSRAQNYVWRLAVAVGVLPILWRRIFLN